MIDVYVWLPQDANEWHGSTWGHAAMYVHNEANGERRYMSFWPRVIACGGSNPISGCAPGSNTYRSDCALESHEPHHDFAFNLGDREDLNEAGILAGWARIRREQPRYAALRNNCCDVVARLLLEDGDGRALRPAVFLPLIPWTPGRLVNLLRNLALRGHGIERLLPLAPPIDAGG
jgi:hypothetical protein